MVPFFDLAVVPVFGETLRAVVRVLLFACSTIPARLAVIALVAVEVAVFNGLAGFRGDAGRAMYAGFSGDRGRTGLRGRVRLL